MSKGNIQEFYKNQTIFVTGGTGHVGLQVIRKLLNTCEVKKIILLIREKKGETPQKRLEAVLESSIFQSLKDQDFKKKILVVSGDCCLPDLGISRVDREMLCREVNCVVNCTANVKFMEPLRNATYVNVRSVLILLQLCKEIHDLKSFVHVSTAYSNCNKYLIGEKFYDPPISLEELLTLVESTDDDTLCKQTFNIILDWPNTYTFTKAIAENVIKEYGQGLPVAIVRPAIVFASVKEPEPGWMESVQGAGELSLGIYLGIIHTLLMNKKETAYYVPLDYTANHIISAGWHVALQSTLTSPRIYNYTGSDKNILTWGTCIKSCINAADKYPSLNSAWMPFLFQITNKYLYLIADFCLHRLPAHLSDCFLLCLRKKPRYVESYFRMSSTLNSLGYFCVNSWKFDSANTEHLWNTMNEKDKEVFPFNLDTVQWAEFHNKLMLIGRERILKDPLETLPQAHRKRIGLKILHYFIVLLSVYFCYKGLCKILT